MYYCYMDSRLHMALEKVEKWTKVDDMMRWTAGMRSRTIDSDEWSVPFLSINHYSRASIVHTIGKLLFICCTSCPLGRLARTPCPVRNAGVSAHPAPPIRSIRCTDHEPRSSHHERNTFAHGLSDPHREADTKASFLHDIYDASIPPRVRSERMEASPSAEA